MLMKKIFTLAAVAMAAASVSAQQVWKAAEFDLSSAVETELTEGIYGGGNADGPDTSIPATLKSSTITVALDGITLTGVSTPNSLSKSDIEQGKTVEYWQLKGSVDGNDALITDVCNPQFAQYFMPGGNPEAIHWEFYEETDNGESFRVYGVYWEIGDNMPVKGAYYKFDATKDGKVKMAIYGNKNTNPTYIVDAATKQPIDTLDVQVSIYYQNTGFAYYKETDDEGNEINQKYFNEGHMAYDYCLQHTNGVTQNRQVLGYLEFPIKAGQTLYVFNPKSQIGIYGFQFTSDGESSVRELNTMNEQAAAAYNLAGQRVDASAKGLVIIGGKKYLNR